MTAIEERPAPTPNVWTAAEVGRGRLRGFHPGWFGAVMGTAVVGIAASQNPGGLPGLADAGRAIGVLMVGLALVLGAALGIPYAARWLRYPGDAMGDLRNPSVGGLHGTFPGGLLVLAIGVATVGPSVAGSGAVDAAVFAIGGVGILLALLIGVAFAATLFLNPTVDPGSVNGSWFIPPVVAVIIPLVLAAMAPRLGPGSATGVLAAGYASLGIGVVLFLLVMGLLYGRLVLRPLPAAPLAPSLWIALGPVGVAALAVLRLSAAGTSVWGDASGAVSIVSAVGATALWGFGLWWLAIAAVLLAVYRRRGPIPFSVGWWGFTFPLGALTTATIGVARAWHAGWVELLGAVLFAALVSIWAAVAGRTLVALQRGDVWAR